MYKCNYYESFKLQKYSLSCSKQQNVLIKLHTYNSVTGPITVTKMVNAFRGHNNRRVLFSAIILMCTDNFCDLTATTVDSQSNAIARIFARNFK